MRETPTLPVKLWVDEGASAWDRSWTHGRPGSARQLHGVDVQRWHTLVGGNVTQLVGVAPRPYQAGISADRHEDLVRWLNEVVGSLVDEFSEQTSDRMLHVRLARLEQQASQIPMLERRLEALEALALRPATSHTGGDLLDVSRDDIAAGVERLATSVMADANVILRWDEGVDDFGSHVLEVSCAGLGREEVSVARASLLRLVHEELPNEWFRAVILKVVRVAEGS